MKRYWTIEIISYLLALLFFLTALSKITDFDRFTWQINNQPFNDAFTPLLIYILPASELLVSVMLVWPRTRKPAYYAFTGMMLAFTVYVALVTLNFFDRVPCACADFFEKVSWPVHLLINLVFTSLGFIGLRMLKHLNKNFNAHEVYN